MSEPHSFPWWKEGVIYQIYPRSFRDESGDGIGDLKGITERLDYLNNGKPDSLGVDAIWLSPIYPSPQKDFGYDISDYCAIDPTMGTLEDFKALVEESHKRSLRVILDLVFNHTSSEHSWFTESRSSKENPKADWYIWRGDQLGKAPNNWQSVFGGSGWEWDDQRSQHYLHSFDKDQPDLNWHNPEVRQALWDVMNFWLDLGVDGFRLDVFNQYYKDDQFRSNPRKKHPLYFFAGLFYGYIGHHHLYDRDRPEMMDTLKKMRQIIDAKTDGMLIGETLDEGTFEKAHGYYGENQDGLNLVFNFHFLRSPWKAESFKRAVQKWHSAIPSWAWPTYVLGNHDVRRHYSRYGNRDDRAKVAAALLLTLRGTPVLYYGEELGMEEGKIPRSLIQDPPGKRFYPFYKGRDGCRTPMQWDNSEKAGFTTAIPWLPLSQNHRQKNVETQKGDETSLLSFYKKLIWFRKGSQALTRGTLELFSSPKGVLSYKRTWEGESLWVVLNFGDKKVSLAREGEFKRVSLGTHRKEGEEMGEHLLLKPCEVLVVGM